MKRMDRYQWRNFENGACRGRIKRSMTKLIFDVIWSVSLPRGNDKRRSKSLGAPRLIVDCYKKSPANYSVTAATFSSCWSTSVQCFKECLNVRTQESSEPSCFFFFRKKNRLIATQHQYIYK